MTRRGPSCPRTLRTPLCSLGPEELSGSVTVACQEHSRESRLAVLRKGGAENPALS